MGDPVVVENQEIEIEKLKEELLNTRIALQDRNNTIIDLENKVMVQSQQLKENDQILSDIKEKFEKEVQGLKDIIMTKVNGIEEGKQENELVSKSRKKSLMDEVAFLNLKLKHLSSALDDENREKMTIIKEKDKALEGVNIQLKI